MNDITGPAAGRPTLPKAATGIRGLDDVTGGGLPRGRPTLVCGSAGCGKTLLAVEFLVRGAVEFGEPGVLMAFEESVEELAANVRSLGFDLDDLVARKLLSVDHVRVDRGEIEETGAYDLEGLFVRLGYDIDTLGAKRVVLDTIETLFGGLQNTGVLRSELNRLFRWLKEKGVTAVITGEKGDGTLTRHGLEEYVSDCVILLDHRVTEQVSTRRLRIVKYRGSAHGTNELPFLIDEDGITVVPLSSAGMDHPAPTERVSSGLPALDEMLGGRGFYRGSSVLISGTAGTGKTSLAAHFAAAACGRGEKALFFSFEESADQLARNMRSIGLDLPKCEDGGLFGVKTTRPSRHGLEMHLALIHKAVGEFRPAVVVVDPISSFLAAGGTPDAASMLVRLLDLLKTRGITAVFTNQTHAGGPGTTDMGVSSIIDTWVVLADAERGGERAGTLTVLKSRGMAHSKRVRELRMTDRGLELTDPPEEARHG